MLTIERVRAEARTLYGSPGFRRAYVRGWAAGANGYPIEACPYRKPGWAAWRKAWEAGWRLALRA